ncbi:hypothetical protein [Brevundimonas sp. FT23028]|uniref:hypothetical protein n=1 Tax=Brevundimonas sp. FT23028 TaxID=3393748 RepID=UPI003B58738E
MRVTIALEEGFGDTGSIPTGEAFWLVSSPANRDLAERLWAEGGRDTNSAVFKRAEGWSDAEVLIGLWGTLLDHHPDLTEVMVPGYRPEAGFAEAVAPFRVIDLGDATLLRR